MREAGSANVRERAALAPIPFVASSGSCVVIEKPGRVMTTALGGPEQEYRLGEWVPVPWRVRMAARRSLGEAPPVYLPLPFFFLLFLLMAVSPYRSLPFFRA